MNDLFPAASAAAMAHAESEYPKEAVGIVTLDGEYVPLVNVSRTPTETFELSEDDDIAYATLDDDGNPKVAAFLHSECYERGEINPLLIGPSKEDMEQCIATNCTWGLVPCINGVAEKPLYWGEFLLDTPLLGRPFVPQVTDCLNFIRSFYWQVYGILVPEVPRGWEWWLEGGNLFEEGLRTAGFHKIDIEEMAPGDGVLLQIRSPVPNHAMIVLDAGLMVHHPQQMLSVREPFGRWRPYTVYAVRHNSFGDKPPPVPPIDLSTTEWGA